MFEIAPSEYINIPFASPKLLGSYSTVPSTPVKFEEQTAPAMTPDYNLRLLMNSVLSSPVKVDRKHQLTCSSDRLELADLIVNSPSRISQTSTLIASTSTDTSLCGSAKSRSISSGDGDGPNHALKKRIENETSSEFKKRKNRIYQQRSRANRKNLVNRLQKQIQELTEILAEKDSLIASLLPK